jgi:hypothetical protein
LVLAELAARLLGHQVGERRLPRPYDHAAIDRFATSPGSIMFDPLLGWVTTPGAERVQGDVRYRHNQDGLRADRSYSPTPAAGVWRIAAYGDSFTYCGDVDQRLCWTQRLEESLPDSEVLNFGVVGFSPDQAWLRYQRDGASWRPCAVLIGHMVENVNRVVNRFRPFYAPETGIYLAKPRYILEGDRLVLLPSPSERLESLKDPLWVETNLGPHDAWYFPGIFVPNPLDGVELVRLARTVGYVVWRLPMVEWQAWSQQAYRPGTETFTVLLEVLTSFARQVEADGATPIVLIFPSGSEITAHREGRSVPHSQLVEQLRQRGTATIDLTDAFGELARGSRLDELIAGHYTPRGNEIVANVLAKELPRLTARTCQAPSDWRG